MRCPNDSTELIVTERQGIDLNYCPSCKGMWLERGELDEIINRSIPHASGAGAPQTSRGFMDGAGGAFEDRLDSDKSRRRRDKYSDDDYGDRPRKGRKKKSKRDMLEDLLDF